MAGEYALHQSKEVLLWWQDICEKKGCNDEDYIVAYSKKFNMQKKFTDYIELYATVLEE